MMKSFIDITVTLKSGMVHWPGDPPVIVKNIQSIAKGDAANVSKMDIGTHTGTHMDAPRHFIQGGKSIDQMPPSATIGRARVIQIYNEVSITPEELEKHRIKRGERILFKTINSSRCWKTKRFMKDFVFISLEAANYLAKKRVQTVGIDYLSVGGYMVDGSAIHRALLKSGMWIIEGLNLSKVKTGSYELFCLPLKLFNGDGAPARAVLKKIKPNKALGRKI